MSLDYNTTKKENYKLLSETEQRWHHNVIPFVLMRIGINKINKKNIPEIMLRTQLIRNLFHSQGLVEQIEKPEFWMKYDGFYTNSSTFTRSRFLKSVLEEYEEKCKVLDQNLHSSGS